MTTSPQGSRHPGQSLPVGGANTRGGGSLTGYAANLPLTAGGAALVIAGAALGVLAYRRRETRAGSV